MSNLFLFALLGLGTGALYAGLALSVVLTYRGSGMINMAAGSMAVVAAFVFFGLRTGGYIWLPPLPFAPHRIHLGDPWSFLPSFLVVLAVSVLMGVLLEFLVVRPLRASPPLAKLVATLGLLLTIDAAVLLRFGSTGQIAPAVLPAGNVTVLGSEVPQDHLWLAAIVLAVGVALFCLYRLTAFGLSTRAAAENETVARLAGLSPNRLSMINTVLAALVAGTLGVLAAPLSQLDSSTIPFAIVPALGAALLARFTSFLTAALAGLGMGVIGSLLIYLQTKSWFPTAGGAPLPGVTDVVFFVIIVAATIWRGSKIPDRGATVERRLPKAPAARSIFRPAVLCAIATLVASLVFPYDFRQALINTLIGTIVCLSLVVITGFVGQVSLLQVTLAGIAGFALQKFASDLGIGFPFGPLIAIAGAMLFGLLAAVSALRVRGVNLGIVTLAAAVMIENFWFQNTSWGAGYAGSPVGRPHLFGLDLGPKAAFPVGASGIPNPLFVIECGAVAILLAVLVASVRRSGLGQRMLAVRANERAAAAAGIDVTRVKLSAFLMAAAIAGAAGCLYAYSFGSVSAERYGPLLALMFVAFAYIGGITTVVGALLGGLAVTEGLIGHALNKWLGVPPEYQLLVGGLLLVVTVIANPAGLALSKPPPPIGALLARLRSTPIFEFFANTKAKERPAELPLKASK